MPTNDDDLARLKRASGVVVGEAGEHLGTCFLIRADLALTCVHVGEASPRVRVRFEGHSSEFEASEVGRDEDPIKGSRSDDALLLKLSSRPDSQPLPVSASRPAVGTRWTSYGYPAVAKHGVLLSGTVSDLDGKDSKGQPAMVLECPAAKDEYMHGLSGSPVVVDGKVIGHMRRIVARTKGDPAAAFGYLFATPASRIHALLSKYIAVNVVDTKRPTSGKGPERPVRTLTLRATNAGWRGPARKFELPIVRVGRASTADLKIEDDHVSKEHGVFRFDDKLYYQDTSRGGSTLKTMGKTEAIAFEQTVEVPLFASIELGESGVSIEVTAIGKGRRGDS
jgi:hypothetical protein